MAIYVIGDLHLSVEGTKPMDIFSGWEGYMEKLEASWRDKIRQEDTVVLAGDISWGMSIAEAIPDFKYLERLPGEKLILKGNHDYWWGSVASMKRVLGEHGVASVDFLHNNHFIREGLALCGSRGWMFESGQTHDEKIIRREALRIAASLESVKEQVAERVLFLHYPPLFAGQATTEYIEIMNQYGVKRCYYGHIHGKGSGQAVTGLVDGINYYLISADYLDFSPLKIITD